MSSLYFPRVSKTGWTPLHSAVMSNDKILVEELLSRGADASLKATKKDIQGGAQLTTKELAMAIGFKHLEVFDKLYSEKEKEKKTKIQK